MTQWQPISTAPTGEAILVIIKGNHPDTGKPFMPGVACLDEDGWLMGWADHDDYPRDNYEEDMDGAETWDDIFGRVHLREWKLTHWMPLPSPPKGIE